MFKKFYHLFFAHVWYIVGDVVCRINAEWAANLYQRAMNKSFNHDEKVGFYLWQEKIN